MGVLVEGLESGLVHGQPPRADSRLVSSLSTVQNIWVFNLHLPAGMMEKKAQVISTLECRSSQKTKWPWYYKTTLRMSLKVQERREMAHIGCDMAQVTTPSWAFPDPSLLGHWGGPDCLTVR